MVIISSAASAGPRAVRDRFRGGPVGNGVFSARLCTRGEKTARKGPGRRNNNSNTVDNNRARAEFLYYGASETGDRATVTATTITWGEGENPLMGNITPQKIIIYVKFGRAFLWNIYTIIRDVARLFIQMTTTTTL